MNALIKNGFILLAFFFASLALGFIINYSRYSAYGDQHAKYTFAQVSKICSIDFSDKSKNISSYDRCFVDIQDEYLTSSKDVYDLIGRVGQVAINLFSSNTRKGFDPHK